MRCGRAPVVAARLLGDWRRAGASSACRRCPAEHTSDASDQLCPKGSGQRRWRLSAETAKKARARCDASSGERRKGVERSCARLKSPALHSSKSCTSSIDTCFMVAGGLFP